MCGICGFALAARSSDAARYVQAMAGAMVHRGPDEEGFLLSDPRAPGLGLGMRRLSIIDLPGGHQPVWNETHDVAVVYNGELYNYRELRQRLALCGHKFATQSDTEILVHAWEEWGEDCLNELRGMFAFALLDLRKRFATAPILFLARDPLGIKPLYYTQTSEGFAFASELRALISAGITSREISPDAITAYLLFGSVSEPITLLEGVFSVPPGHRLLLYVPDRRRIPRPRRWWDPHRSPAAMDTRKPSELSDAASRLRPLLEDAIKKHLIADVPVGLFLSSGLDSSAIASLAARERARIQSFTLSFPGTAYDEAPLARLVAQRCGTNHTEVPLDGESMIRRVDEAVAALDLPTMDGINTYFISWAARELGLKVALSGLGGDELFGGYKTFTDTPKLQRLELLAQFVPGAFRRIMAPLVRSLGAGQGSPDAAGKIAASWLTPSALPHPYFFTRLLFPPNELSRLTEPRFRPSTVSADGFSLEPTWLGWLERAADEARKLEPMGAVSWLEMRTYMVNTLLRDTDSVSMSRSLEVRVPLLDTPLVEFVLALPDAARQREGVKKALLVEALRDVLPIEILAQRKRTFTLPWEDWMRGPLRARVEASMADIVAPLAPHIRAEGAQSVWKSFLAGQTSWSRPWSLYVLNEWCRRNLGAST
ncbi:MAG TPA: asparagine synthase (glutamine-hydrolyzing) [Candidatus Eremiobacteraceae bacterium]|nr:asparagine synthase (glutamine-hydrolyzing) [Candidatus Eremiobacteraceae bacterium]